MTPDRPFILLALDMGASVALAVPGAVVERATFAALDAPLLSRIQPDQIMLPLLCPGHDASQVVERLEHLAYAGQITVIAPRLPKARMVEAELRALGPGPRLTLLSP